MAEQRLLGVDMGVSAVKLALLEGGTVVRTARVEAGRFQLSDLDELLQAGPEAIAVTGMGASRFGETFRGLPVRQVPEFSAIAAGALAFSGLARALVASVGTGTAFVMAARGEPARHLGGSGVGGGTLMGLVRHMGGEPDAERVAECAARGDLRAVDLCIGDLTDREIPGLPLYTTVSNFARLGQRPSPDDLARGTVNLVCQTVGVMAVFAARAECVQDVVLIGTPVTLPVFQELIHMVERLHPVRFHVPPLAPFATAAGAALSAFSPEREPDIVQ